MRFLAALGLTTPAMLFGAGLLLLPIAAHLLRRRARRRLVFPSVALVTAAAAGPAATSRLRRWGLLLLRCLAVALAVLAFARPVWVPAAAPGVGARPAGTGAAATVVVVVVLDRSASTRQLTAEGTPVWDRLRRLARDELARLNDGADLAAVVLADAAPSAVFGRLTPNLPMLREALSGIDATDHRADFSAALGLAGELLRGGPEGARREVVVVTDGQQTNWTGVAGLGLPNGTTLSLRGPGDGPPEENTALRLARALPGRPGVGVPVQLGVEVAHFGKAPTRQRVDLIGPAGQTDSRWVRLEPGERRQVDFTRRLAEPGPQRFRFALGRGDALAHDNNVDLIVRAVRRQPVIVVGGGDSRRAGSASYYLTRALAPHGGARDRYRVTHLAADGVDDAALRGAALVCVAGPGVPAAVRAYAEAGGSVLVFAGADPVRSGPLLPWTLGSRLSSVKLDAEGWRAPELAAFDEAAREALAGLSLRRAWGVEAVKPGARVLLRFRGGSPAMAAHAIGRGRVVAAAFSPAAETGDLGKVGGFVVLMQGLAEELAAREPTPAPSFAGGPAVIRSAIGEADVAAAAEVVYSPSGEPVSGVALGFEAGRASATVRRADTAGVYVWRRGGISMGSVSVEVDPRESDLTAAAAETLARILEPREGVAFAAGRGRDASRGGEALWGWALLGALGLLGLERGLLGVWRR